MIEVYPFERLSWKSKKIEEKWDSLRQRIYDATGFAEYEMVKRGFRDADVYQLDPDRFDWQINKVMLDGLAYLSILRSKRYRGYGHRHYVADEIDSDTFIYGVVAKNLDSAIEFHDAGVTDVALRVKKWPPEQMNPSGIDHDVTGRLLGYPKCDRDFFRETWLRDGCVDPMFEIAVNTKNSEITEDNKVRVSGHAYLNRLIRYWGFNIIPYFPHSFDCEESIEFAVKWFSLMREYDEEAADACAEILNMPMRWSLRNCIIYVEHPLFFGAANGYYTDRKLEVIWIP